MLMVAPSSSLLVAASLPSLAPMGLEFRPSFPPQTGPLDGGVPPTTPSASPVAVLSSHGVGQRSFCAALASVFPTRSASVVDGSPALLFLSAKIDSLAALFWLTLIGKCFGLQNQQLCIPSSCGGLQIRYPFRLKGDPVNCGDRNYELTCSGNRTFMEFQSSQYFVQKITYGSQIIQVIEVGLLRSNCSLPLKSLSASSMSSSRYYFTSWSWVSLMNCSKKLTSQKYQLFPCLSQKDSYVYGVSSEMVRDLAPSCSFLTMMLTDGYTLSGQSDLFHALHDGFSLSWSTPGFSTSILIRCLRESSSMFQDNFKTSNFLSLIPAVFKAEMHFPACLEYFTPRYNVNFRLSIVVTVIIQIVQIMIVWLLMGRLVFAPLSLCIFVAHKFWSNWASEDAVEKFLQTQQSLSPTRFAYTDIIAITSHFKEQLGRGGFGSVYKGELPGGHFVAVKMLAENSKCNGDDFISEVSTIGRIHHLNVVRLVGFCSEGSKTALIYEYMPNGSLDKYIFSSSNKTVNRYFTWQKLNSIAIAVARGIDYLHCGCDMTILHFDIKPQNILLDQSFIPKVSDFGLAKLYPKEYNVVSFSAARGTIGYIAPELVSRNFGVISHKSDVYSFGMLLLEMAAGRRNVDTNAGSSSQNYYPSVIYDKLNNAKEGIKFECSFEMNEVEKKLYLVGLWCIQIRPHDRPSMSQVVQMLEEDADALQLPPKPFLSWSSSSISTTLHSDNTATAELTVIHEDEIS